MAIVAAIAGVDLAGVPGFAAAPLLRLHCGGAPLRYNDAGPTGTVRRRIS